MTDDTQSRSGAGRVTPDERLTLNLSADERELLHSVIIAGVDHLSHEDTSYDNDALREFQSSILSKIQHSVDVGGGDDER
jgi:hypothetical protein